MTPDEKRRRLTKIRKACGPYREDECSESSEIGVAMFLLRLLDEVIAERDAAMAENIELKRQRDAGMSEPTEEVSG